MKAGFSLKRILSDFEKRTLLFAAVTLFINLSYAAYSVFLAFFSSSLWHLSLGVYYIVLASERFHVLSVYGRMDRKDSGYLERQLRIYRRSGILMIVLHLILSGAMAEFVFVEKGFRVSVGTVYFSVVYAACKVFSAVYNVFLARKSREAAIRAARSISLADASVSLLALQTVVNSKLSESFLFYTPLNLLSSALVSIFTLSLGVYTVINANKGIKEARKGRIC